ncbi:uncharacterized protein [Elaeis guineensis]
MLWALCRALSKGLHQETTLIIFHAKDTSRTRSFIRKGKRKASSRERGNGHPGLPRPCLRGRWVRMTTSTNPPRFKRPARKLRKKATAFTAGAAGAGVRGGITAPPATPRPPAARLVTLPRSLLAPAAILPQDFFLVDSLDLARRLLGKFLRRDEVVLQITEVEAYRPSDSACHGRFGITTRTAPVFGPGGHAYVYLCYGLHMMLNIVADKQGVGAAVLIRSCSPVGGLETIQERRGQKTDKPVLLTGPGKVYCNFLLENALYPIAYIFEEGQFCI